MTAPRLVLALAVLAVAGCGSSRTTEAMAPAANRQAHTARLVAELGLATEAEHVAAFEDGARGELFAGGRFREGNEVIVLYRLTAAEPGNRFLRFVSLGLGGGRGGVEVAATYRDGAGQTIGRATVHAELSGGLTGGSLASAFADAGEAVARYAVDHFLLAPGSDRSANRVKR